MQSQLQALLRTYMSSSAVTVATVALALACAVALVALYQGALACVRARRRRAQTAGALPEWAATLEDTAQRPALALIATHTNGPDLPVWAQSSSGSDSRATTPPFAWQSLYPVSLPQSGAGAGSLGLYASNSPPTASDARLPSPPPSPPRPFFLRHFPSAQSLRIVPARGRVNIDPEFSSDSGSECSDSVSLSGRRSSTASETRARSVIDENGEPPSPILHVGEQPSPVLPPSTGLTNNPYPPHGVGDSKGGLR